VQGEVKPHLREFQERLAERLRGAVATPRVARLGLAIDDRRWLVDLADAGEILPVPSPIAPLPNTQDWFRGLVNLRGTLYGVTDLLRLAGGCFTPLAKESRLLARSARLNVQAALLASHMLGLHDPTSWREDGGRALALPWSGRCLVDDNGREWHELDLARLAADENFLAVCR
jgi:twitching motility protein PilI